MYILVSACLLGLNCRYDGTGGMCNELKELEKEHHLIPVCPEIFGGLPTPRTPAEIRDGEVITRDGKNVSEEYHRGAAEVLKLMKFYRCSCAVLKERSPSCGHGCVYDGTFSRKLIEGDGITAKLLMRHGVTVYGESEVPELLKLLQKEV